MFITFPPCAEGEVLPLLPPDAPLAAALFASTSLECEIARRNYGVFLKVGTVLHTEDGTAIFQVCGRISVPGMTSALTGPLIRALTTNLGGRQNCHYISEGFAVAVITLSDKGSQGLRVDASGPLALRMARDAMPVGFGQTFILPDDPYSLRALVLELAHNQHYDLILTTGGTGLTARDTTPEALLPILDRRLPGFEQAMMLTALSETPHAMLSRAVAGTVCDTLLISLPGNVRAVNENLSVVLPACVHAMEKLHNVPGDCGTPGIHETFDGATL